MYVLLTQAHPTPQLSIVHVTTININSSGNISHYLLNALYSSGVAEVIGYTMQLTSHSKVDGLDARNVGNKVPSVLKPGE